MALVKAARKGSEAAFLQVSDEPFGIVPLGFQADRIGGGCRGYRAGVLLKSTAPGMFV